MKWMARFHDEFEALPSEVQDELLAHAKVLARIGPTLGRPRVDTLAGSKHATMKEMRFEAADGAWRVGGISQERFYRSLIERTDDRFDRHLAVLRKKAK